MERESKDKAKKERTKMLQKQEEMRILRGKTSARAQRG